VVKVVVVGDIMLGRRVGAHAAAVGDPAAPLRPLQSRLAAADLTVGNLESTLSTFGLPRQGGDSFAADPAVLPGLRAAGFDVLSLANNHTGDFGPKALRQTVRRVHRGGIHPVGAGPDRRSAWRPVVLSRRGISFGFLAFNAIGETPRATRQSPGAASVRMEPRTGPLSRHDLAATKARVRRLAKRVDVVIVLPHWGDQYTHRPVPDQRRVGRALIAAGATAVVGGHPHWVQDVEKHDDRLLVHSLGNFVFDMDFSLETREGVLLELTFRGEDVEAARLVPYRIDEQFRPQLVHGAAAQSVLQGIKGLRHVSVPPAATPTPGR
jgi:poly-gamma-glutamate synthesis protein (capsule biosynthesis protein)